MNAALNIIVTVRNRGAGELARTTREMKGLGTAAVVTGAKLRTAFRDAAHHLENFGKNLQWTGRQLEFRFTLPLVMAGAAAGRWALDNERALTRIRKVYGDAGDTTRDLEGEVKSLTRAFRALSDIFGVNQDEVLDIAGVWAQAGSAGIALAKQTRATLEAMILGDMEAADAAKALISIQSQLGLSTDELTGAMAMLNMVENETAVNLPGLIESFVRAGGTARTAGVDMRHLAAMTASLVPAAGSAEQAGNAIKTMLSRVMAPTRETSALFGELGIAIDNASWQGLNGVERLSVLAEKFAGLTSSQRAVVSATVASRWQVSKFDVLMRDIANPLSNYNKALAVTADEAKNVATYHREIGIFLRSSPQAFKIMTTRIKNALAEVMFMLMPTILSVLNEIVKLTDWFSNLDPAIQKAAVAALMLLAVLGPILAYIGAFTTLAGRSLAAVSFLGEALAFAAARVAGLAGWLGRLALAPFQMIWAGLLGIGRAAVVGASIAGTGLQGLVAITTAAYRMLLFRLAQFVAADRGIRVAHWAWALAVEAAGWARSNAIGVLMYAQVLAAEAVFHGRRIALAVIYWARDAALRAAAWVLEVAWIGRRIAAWTLYWSITLQAMAAGWAGRIARDVAGWVATVAVDAAGWARRHAATVAGWVALHATHVAGWVAARAVALAGSLGVQTAALGWIAVVIAAVGGLAYLFRSQIGRALNALPQAFFAAFGAVVRIVKKAALAVYEWLSWMNPFARHSPSLVEQVTAGVDLIARRYASLSNIGAPFRRAVNDFRAFLAVTQSARSGMQAAQLAEKRQDVTAVSPGAGAAFDGVVRGMTTLQTVLSRVGQEFAQQSRVVDAYAAAVDTAAANLQTASDRLEVLDRRAGALRDQLTSAQDELSTLMQTPIAGMGAMEDAIFRNEMAQKRLRLEMLKMGEQSGGSVDDLRSKMSRLAGDIEMMRSEATDLRLAGAGSDVLGVIESQIRQAEDARDALGRQAGAFDGAGNPLQDQLDKLRIEGEILELEKALKFDPLIRQVERLGTNLNELPFEVLRDRIVAQQKVVDKLEGAYRAAEDAATTQRATVDQLSAAHDAARNAYDREKAKLDELGDAYDAVERQIRDMESALDDMAAAASQALGGLGGGSNSTAVNNLLNAGLGDFETPGGNAALGFEEGDIDALADQWIEEARGAFDDIDLFAGLKDQFGKIKRWIGDNIGPIFEPIKRAWDRVFGGLDTAPLQGAFEGVLGIAGRFWSAFEEPLNRYGALFADFWSTIGSILGGFVNAVGDLLARLWAVFQENAGPLFKELEQWIPVLADLFDVVVIALEAAWGIIKPVLMAILALFWFVWPAIRNVVVETFRAILRIITPLLRAIRGVIQVIAGLIKGDWSLVWKGIKNIVSGAFGVIVGIIEGALRIAWGIISGIGGRIIEVFGRIASAIGGTLGGAFSWISRHVSKVFGGIGGAADTIAARVGGAFTWLRDHIGSMFSAIGRAAGDVARTMMRSIGQGVNIVIDVINTLIRGINTVKNMLRLPFGNIREIGKLSVSIGKEKLFASGGVLPVGEGFVTNRATAIVGEGSRSWPEFVIPTDPRYRSNALDLIAAAASRIGVALDGRDGTPQLAGGGILDDLGGALGGAVDAGRRVVGGAIDTGRRVVGGVVGTARAAAVNAAFAPVRAALNGLLSVLPSGGLYDVLRGMATKVIDSAYEMLRGDGGALLANGGIVRARAGGIQATIGEGGRDEAVIPLPRNFDPDNLGAREYHFHGGITLPNIRTGEDAQDFLDNLEALVN